MGARRRSIASTRGGTRPPGTPLALHGCGRGHNPDLGRRKPPKVALVAVKLKLLLLANALLRQNWPWTPAVSRTATPPAEAGPLPATPPSRGQPPHSTSDLMPAQPDTPKIGAMANFESYMHVSALSRHLQHGHSSAANTLGQQADLSC